MTQDETTLLAPSQISMTLGDGTVWGLAPKLKSVKRLSENKLIKTPRYKSTEIVDNYNGVLLSFGEWQLEFRAFNDAVAYRFISDKKGNYTVKAEQANYNFLNDAEATFPYVYSSGNLNHGINADNNGEDYKIEKVNVGNYSLSISMAAGGGFVIVI